MAESVSSTQATLKGPAAPAKTRAARRPRRRWLLWLLVSPLILVGLLAAAAIGAVAYYQYSYTGKVYPGVHVAGAPLSGLSFDEAEEAIRNDLTPYPGQGVTLRYGERMWTFTAADLGLAVDSRGTALDAFAIGRSGGYGLPKTEGVIEAAKAQWSALATDLIAQAQAAQLGIDLEPRVVMGDGNVIYPLMRIAREIDQSPQEGTLTVNGLEVTATEGRAGRVVDVDATMQAMLAAARSGRGGAVNLVVVDRQPVVSSTAAAATDVRALLSQPLALIAQDSETTHRFEVDLPTLRQWLDIKTAPNGQGSVDLQVTLDHEQVRAYVQELAGKIDRDVQDAALTFDPGSKQLTVVKPSTVGQKLDVEGGAAALAAVIEARPIQAAAQPREIQLQVTVTQPRIDSNKTAEMGIVELVAQGTTTFAGSSKERVHNIVTAAEKFDNVIVPPDEEFSFNQHVGAITKENGFGEGLVIAGDRTAVGIGGGVCQVSTTAYRAALYGGFPITQRWAHGYVVSWYGKPGMDATIYTPDVDFRFKNDTGHFLAIKPSLDLNKGTITFDFYGTKPAREVQIAEPVITNVKEPEKALYQEDATLKAGEIKQVDWAAKGLEALVVRTIKYPDGTEKKEEIKSKYQPWRAIFLYGPGSQLPAGAVEPKPTATP